MAIVGLSKPYYAEYDTTEHTYSNGASLGKAVSMTIDIDANNDNKDYQDNAAAENDATFGSGTLNITLGDLGATEAAAILNLKKESVTSPAAATKVTYGSNTPPHLGFGVIRKRVVSGVTKWDGIILHNIQFAVPSDAADTQEEEIDWQHTEMEATIMRDGTEDDAWKTIYFDCASEADAESCVKSHLNIT